VAPNICGSLVLNFLHDPFWHPRILRFLIDFFKMFELLTWTFITKCCYGCSYTSIRQPCQCGFSEVMSSWENLEF